ncbi:hypothetical protein CTI12_AA493100 [Artemisia annua]|uniref:Uncharacterized protein n=1 Tax=Artemisia annua TaxID=35608 RepID=A0A2U1LGK5_ARTAN|nr:hypothetical protein CTI12_AA493100 [Artemisia annua]
MELESENGSKITLPKNPNTPIQLGRNSLSQTPDKTVSRHHITLNYNTQKGILKFVVYGKNPIWVHEFDKDEIKVYRRGDKGELKVGDSFCVGGKDFVWFKVREIDGVDEDLKMELGDDFGEIGESLGGGHVTDVDDPVKEFGFVVMGHEFDNYPKKMIRDMRNWDCNRKAKKGKRRKRKKGGLNDDEDDDVWTGESEEDAELIKKLRNDPKPKYKTRSKDQKKSRKGASTSRSGTDTTKSSAMDVDVEDDDDEDENDETLGGFIVDDEDMGEGIDEDPPDITSAAIPAVTKGKGVISFYDVLRLWVSLMNKRKYRLPVTVRCSVLRPQILVLFVQVKCMI